MTVIMFLAIVGLGGVCGTRLGVAMSNSVTQSFKTLICVVALFIGAWVGGIFGLIAAAFNDPEFIYVEEMAQTCGQGMLVALASIAAGMFFGYTRPDTGSGRPPEPQRRKR